MLAGRVGPPFSLATLTAVETSDADVGAERPARADGWRNFRSFRLSSSLQASAPVNPQYHDVRRTSQAQNRRAKQTFVACLPQLLPSARGSLLLLSGSVLCGPGPGPAKAHRSLEAQIGGHRWPWPCFLFFPAKTTLRVGLWATRLPVRKKDGKKKLKTRRDTGRGRGVVRGDCDE